MPLPPGTFSPRVLQWLCGLSALFLLIAGSWAAYTYAFYTIFPLPHLQMSYQPEYYLARVRMVGTLIFLPILVLTAVLIACGIFLRRLHLSGSFPGRRACLLQWCCVILSWRMLLAGTFLAGPFVLQAIALASPVNTSLDLAVSIFIFTPALFLFMVLNVVSTLIKLDLAGDFAL